MVDVAIALTQQVAQSCEDVLREQEVAGASNIRECLRDTLHARRLVGLLNACWCFLLTRPVVTREDLGRLNNHAFVEGAAGLDDSSFVTPEWHGAGVASGLAQLMNISKHSCNDELP